MLINEANLSAMLTGFRTAFDAGFQGAVTHYRDVAMTVTSQTREENFAWLGQFPKVREWLGPRHIKNLEAHGFTIKNRRFENTVSIPRENIEDDTAGVYVPVVTELGKSTAEHPDELVFDLLKSGFTTEAYDGQYFFDTEHLIKDASGAESSVSNMQAGAGTPWFLLDTSRPFKPLIHQQRIPFTFAALNKDGDENVFMDDEYIYGVRGRSNVGFGLWQLAFGSKDTLDSGNYALARVAMMGLKGDEGRILGIRPTTLVVPPSLESAGLKLLNSEHGTGGETNEWKGTAKLIVTPWLA